MNRSDKFDRLNRAWQARLDQLARTGDHSGFERLCHDIPRVAESYIREESLDEWYKDLAHRLGVDFEGAEDER